MVFPQNFLKWLFLAARRRLRTTRIIISTLTVVALWQLYLVNNGYDFPEDRIYFTRDHRKTLELADGKLATDFQLSFRDGIFAFDAEDHQEENDFMSQRGAEKDWNDRNVRNELSRMHPDFKTKNVAVNIEGESLSDLLSSRNVTTEELRHRFCEDFSLTPTNKHSYGTCEPHKPTGDACKLAKAFYYYDPSLSECKRNKESSEICSFEAETVRKKTVLKAKCDERVCKKLLTDDGRKSKINSLTFAVYTIDPEDGLLKSLRNFTRVSELETQLPRIALLTARHKFNFVFVKCFDVGQQTLASQLISLPPAMSTTQEAPKIRARNAINVNIILLDSVSRAHFYRSLPKTVETFRKLAEKSNNAGSARVFDFELFQAVHGHTTQNEHALFTGQLLPPLDPEEEPPAVKAEVLFGHFKNAGYQTMWQEDLCWTAGWGLVADLDAEDWEELQYRLEENFVDNTGGYAKIKTLIL